MSTEEIYIVAARRTPIGAFLGGLSTLTAPALGSIALRAALESAQITGAQLDEVYMGNVLSAGIGQAPARQAALFAEIPNNVPTTTVSKVCGSGLQAVILARRAILTSEAHVVVAGGMECMSQAPHYLKGARSGIKMGSAELIDGMVHDGLWDPYNNFHMGSAGELCAKEFGLTREAQDAFATESYRRAREAQAKGAFADEICAVTIPQKKGAALFVDVDEEPARGLPEKFPTLRPAFDPQGTITAANASSVNDGAAAIVLASGHAVKAHGLKPLARIVSSGQSAQAPEWFTTAPKGAMDAALARAKMTTDDIDLFEINEAFSCVTLACSKLAALDPERVNIHGGAVALGHPIGASGARILATLVHALIRHDKSRGLATLCIGGGEAVAVVIERV